MKAGREFDMTIALKVMKMSAIEPVNILNYSTDIFCAYTIIQKMQQMGWLCNVSSRVNDVGLLLYKVKFYRYGSERERFSDSMAEAICFAALDIVENNYFEYTDVLKNELDENNMEIVAREFMGLPTMVADHADIIKLFVDVIENNFVDAISYEEMAQRLLDKLTNETYIIIQKV